MANEAFSNQQIDQIRLLKREFTKELSEMLVHIVEDNQGLFGRSTTTTTNSGAKGEAAQQKQNVNQMKRHGAGLKLNTKAVKANTQAEEKSTEATEDNTAAKDDNTGSVKKSSKMMDALRKDGESLGESFGRQARQFTAGFTFMTGATALYTDMQEALKVGASYDPLSALSMGVTPKDLIELQTQFKQTALASSTGVAGFTASVSQLQDELFARTGNLRDAAFVAANMYDLSQSIGVQAKNISDQTVPAMVTAFKQMQDQVGMTGDEFVKMNRGMLADGEIRETLMRLNEDQRESYMLGLNQQAQTLMQLGYTADEAESLVKRIAKVGTTDPKERIKQAAKLQAMAGAYGMGDEGARMAEIVRKGTRASGDELAELTLLTRELSNVNKQQMGQDLRSELIGSNLLKQSGMEGLLTDTNATMQQGKASNQIAFEASQRNALNTAGWQVDMLEATNHMSAGLQNAVTLLGGAFLLTVGKSAVTKLLSSVAGKGLATELKGRALATAINNPGVGTKLAPVGQMAGRGAMGLARGGVAGLVSVAGSELVDALYTATSEAEAKRESAYKTGGGIAGGMAAGAAMGALGGPVGAAIGGVLGGLVTAGTEYYDWAINKDKKIAEAELAGIKQRNSDFMLGITDANALRNATAIEDAQETKVRAKMQLANSEWLMNAANAEKDGGRMFGFDDLDADEIANKMGITTEAFFKRFVDSQLGAGGDPKARQRRLMELQNGNADGGFDTANEIAAVMKFARDEQLAAQTRDKESNAAIATAVESALAAQDNVTGKNTEEMIKQNKLLLEQMAIQTEALTAVIPKALKHKLSAFATESANAYDE
jgi:hypothetical protein